MSFTKRPVCKHFTGIVDDTCAVGVRYEDVPTGQIFTGHDGVIRMGAQALLMAQDIRFACISAQQSGNQFAFETETHGTNTGAVGPFPATGKPFVLRGVSVGTRTPLTYSCCAR